MFAWVFVCSAVASGVWCVWILYFVLVLCCGLVYGCYLADCVVVIIACVCLDWFWVGEGLSLLVVDCLSLDVGFLLQLGGWV